MQQRKRVARTGKIAALKACEDESQPWQKLLSEIEGLEKPVKKLVRLELDADVLAWFKQAGRGYQTRINRALQTVMMEEKKTTRK